MKKINIVGSILALTTIAAVFWTTVNFQQVADYWTVANYQPNQEIASLADRSQMSDRGRHYFYLADPALESASSFNNDCQRMEQGNPILGCFDQASQRIYIYRVTDSQLDGSNEVTAAHEMLHVAYTRLSQAERSKLGLLLEDAYKAVKTDDLAKRMLYYDRAQPGSRENELHSILATEFVGLGGELEQYYSQYFTDRQAVVALHAKYSQRFTAIVDQANSLSADLATMKPEIDSMQAQYQQQIGSLNAQVDDFNRRANAGEFTSQREFNSQRAGLLAQQSGLQASSMNLQAKIDSYNSKVQQLNSLGWQMEQLNNSLDSTKAVN